MPRKALRLEGQRFGRWTVLQRDGSTPAGAATFLCRCDCGSIGFVVGSNLKNGNSISCGCFARQKLGNYARSHGLINHRLYTTWRAMRERCRSPKHVAFHRYGGRGIFVCSRWDDFSAFLEDMLPTWQEGMTLDRIDNDGPYSPENCRWATITQQANNKTHKDRRLLTHNGKTQSIRDWSRELGLRPDLIRQRLWRGDSDERALRPR